MCISSFKIHLISKFTKNLRYEKKKKQIQRAICIPILKSIGNLIFFSVRETCFHTTTRRFDNNQAALKQACRLSEGFSHVDEVTISGVYWSHLWWGPLDTGMRKAGKPPQKYPIPTPSHIEFFSSEKERHSEMQNWTDTIALSKAFLHPKENCFLCLSEFEYIMLCWVYLFSGQMPWCSQKHSDQSPLRV